MTVHAALAGPDGQMVVCLRLCTCSCRPQTETLQLDELPVPMHELDLVRLAELSDLPVHRPCSSCGRDTVADYRVAAVVPQERSLPALVHVRRGGEKAYALVARGNSTDSETVARTILEGFPDPERRQQIAGDEDELVQLWGRPLSPHALVRAWFAGFLASGKTARILWPGDAAAYLFTRRDEDDPPTAADVADMLSQQWGAAADALLFFSAEEGLGRTGTLLECLGPARAGLEQATITCIANTASLERQTRDALAAHNLTWQETRRESGALVFHLTRGGIEAELPVAEVARSALLYGRTGAEAAELEVQRLILKVSGTAIMNRFLQEQGASDSGAPAAANASSPDAAT